MSSLQQSTNAFDALPIRQAVFRQTFPAIASQMITLIYNLADTYFVGMLNQPSQTAAITVVYSSFLMLTAISNLFGVGGASALARALGRKAPDEARRIASISFWFGLFSGALFCLLFWCFRQPILVLCGATQDTLPIALGYAQWVVVIGGPATILSTLLANLVRAEGKAGQASFGLSLGGAANLVLDPLFILPQFLGLGAVGAGMATCLSNVLSTLYFLVHLLRCQGETAVDLHPRHLPFIRKYGKEILAIGFPSALQYALTVVAVAAQSRFVSRYATEAVAGLGIVKKLDQLPLYFSIGVSNGLLPLLAYHYAAGQQEKRRAAFRLGCTLSLAFALLCLVTFELFAPQLASLLLQRRISAANGHRHAHDVPVLSDDHPVSGHGQSPGIPGLLHSSERGPGHPFAVSPGHLASPLRLYVGTAHCRHHLSDRRHWILPRSPPERGCFPIKNLRSEHRCGGFLS